MNRDQIKGTLGILVGKAKVVYGELTNNESLKAEGSADKLYGLLQQKVGEGKQLLKAKIDKVRLP